MSTAIAVAPGPNGHTRGHGSTTETEQSNGSATTTLERHLGEDAHRITRLEDASRQWAIIDKGLLVDVHIGHWRAEVRMTLEDLGLDQLEQSWYVEALQDLTALGTKYLLPRRVIQRIARAEQRGRAVVNRHSFNLRTGKFVPFTAYRSWKDANAEAEAAFFAARDDVCEHLANYRLEVIDGYVRIARVNFDLLRQRGVSLGMSRSAFVDRYAERIAAQIPSPERIHGSFHWEVRLSFIPMPSAIEQDLKRRETLQLEREAVEHEREARTQEAARVQEMNRDLSEHLKRQKTEQIDGILGHIQRQMLERMYEVTAELAGKVRTNPALSASQVRSVRTMVTQLREMNFLEDASVEQRLASLEGLVEAHRGDLAQAGTKAAEGGTGGKSGKNGTGGVSPERFLTGIDALNDQIRQQASQLLSRRSVRAQMNVDMGGSDMAFGRRVSRLRRDLGDASVPVELNPAQQVERRVRRQVRGA